MERTTEIRFRRMATSILLGLLVVAPGPLAIDALAAQCGNGKINGGEDCDRANLGGANCVSLGFAGGALACSDTCRFDTSACTPDTCAAELAGCQADLQLCESRCDLLLQDCPTDQGCYGTSCSRRGNCSPAGVGTQGASCTTHTDCAAGYGCVQFNNALRCLQLCERLRPCPGGLTCLELEGCSDSVVGVCA